MDKIMEIKKDLEIATSLSSVAKHIQKNSVSSDLSPGQFQ